MVWGDIELKRVAPVLVLGGDASAVPVVLPVLRCVDDLDAVFLDGHSVPPSWCAVIGSSLASLGELPRGALGRQLTSAEKNAKPR